MVLQTLFVTVLILVCLLTTTLAFNDGGSGLLSDIQVLTLKQGHMTAGRRSSPVQQLSCVGGSAKHLFNPPVVQCYNRGSDGYDIQWECKADMDTSYRFGEVTVTCEGYNHPNDPYVLQGSCGLEYTMELTEEGRQKKGSGSSWGSGSWGSSNSNTTGKRVGSIIGDVMSLVIIAGIVYGVYKCFTGPSVSQPHSTESNYSSTPGSGQPPPAGFRPGSGQPPPAGFRSEYKSQDNSGFGNGTSGSSTGQTGGHAGGGGFWSGAGLGGILGYLCGSSRGNRYNQYPGYQQPYTSSWGRPQTGYGSGWGSGWGTGGGSGWGTGGGSGWGNGHSSRSSWGSSSSSSSRTTSGFGGTTRR